jgi:mannosyltransferase OCH1-like enzyme
MKNKQKIPKIIHQVWMGGELPEEYAVYCQGVRDMNPDFEYKLWTDDDIDKFGLENQKLFDATDSYGVKGDIVRYEIINRYGGIYLDVDFIAIKPFTKLLDNEFFAGYECHTNWVFPGLFGSIAGHEINELCISKLHEVKYNRLNSSSDIVRRTGPGLFSSAINRYKQHNDIKLYGKEYFYPISSKLKRKEGLSDELIESCVTDNTYAVHTWASSWVKADG